MCAPFSYIFFFLLKKNVISNFFIFGVTTMTRACLPSGSSYKKHRRPKGGGKSFSLSLCVLIVKPHTGASTAAAGES
jgi:hypothetical protein